MFLSAPVQLGLHSHWGTGASRLIFRFLSNGIGLCIVELVYAGEEGSGSFRLFLLVKVCRNLVCCVMPEAASDISCLPLSIFPHTLF